MSLSEYSELYRGNLLDDVIPFWLKHSADPEQGGYFTCLDREGKVYDTDKFIWLQARQVWCFSMLYNRVEKKQDWLDFALSGAEFLRKHGRDAEGDWFFSLTREGRPLIQPYNIFSDCFAAMAFSELFKATGHGEYRDIAVSTFHRILQRQENPKGKYSKVFPGTRPLQGFSLPMILSNLVLELEHLLPEALVNEIVGQGIHTVMNVFYDTERRLVLENVTTGGAFSDSFEGRLVNPGHGLEAMWFVMELGRHTGNQAVIAQAAERALHLLDYGWDQVHGGIFYFLDVKGHPPQQLEWDQKLWWVHIEALVCVLKAYLYTGNEKFRDWFERLHEYTWKRFPDPLYGEWFGYLDRRGEVLLPLKGGKWKGCFHVPRGLFQCWQTLESLKTRKPVDSL